MHFEQAEFKGAQAFPEEPRNCETKFCQRFSIYLGNVNTGGI